MQKILVTGATGFVGGYVIRELLTRGLSVVASSSGRSKAEVKPWFSNVDYRVFDFQSFDDTVNYFEYFGRPDRMIHLAWEGLPDYKSEKHLAEYFPRHLAFLENMARHGLKNLTVTGTCLEYGMNEGCLKEDMVCDPHLPYPAAKHLLRLGLEKLSRPDGISLKWIRLFYMYGKGQHPKSLFSQLEQAIHDQVPVFNMSPGEQERDFLPVEKVAEYIVTIALQDMVSGVINCCSGKPVRVREWVANFIRAKQSSMQLNTGFYPYPDYEPMSFWGDTNKLKSIIAL
jgi:dTDP-6-deoxy-L-talose 4-dehydrogenase (NAD+)